LLKGESDIEYLVPMIICFYHNLMMDVFGRNFIFLELTLTRQYGDYSRLIEWNHQSSM